VKRYHGTRKDGSLWEKLVTWFGFELHLVVDSHHELPVNYKVTTASASETTELIPLLREIQNQHPKVMDNCEEVSADKGYDSTANINAIHHEFGARPIIDKRSDWKDPDKTLPVFPDRVDTAVYDVKGHVSCVCPATGQMHPMSFWGFESLDEVLKYRCPAVVAGTSCPGRGQCPHANSKYGKIVRIPLEKDRRIFTPLPRDSKSWPEAYAKRTAVERVNSRIDRVLGFEHHTTRGLKKMEARVSIALVVMLSMALGRIRNGQPELMRSLVAPARLAT